MCADKPVKLTSNLKMAVSVVCFVMDLVQWLIYSTAEGVEITALYFVLKQKPFFLFKFF